MIHSQKIVVRRADVAPERVALEEQILHVGRDADGHFIHYLRIGCGRDIERCDGGSRRSLGIRGSVPLKITA